MFPLIRTQRFPFILTQRFLHNPAVNDLAAKDYTIVSQTLSGGPRSSQLVLNRKEESILCAFLCICVPIREYNLFGAIQKSMKTVFHKTQRENPPE